MPQTLVNQKPTDNRVITINTTHYPFLSILIIDGFAVLVCLPFHRLTGGGALAGGSSHDKMGEEA